PAHDMEIDRVKGGHDENSGEQGIYLEAGVQSAGTGSGKHARAKCRQRGERRADAMDEQRGSDGGTKGYGTVSGDVGKREDAKADEHTECEERKDATDGKGGGLNRSTQHFPGVYSPEFENPKFVVGVDSSAARLCSDPTGNSWSGRRSLGSTDVRARLCFRSSRVARDSADRRSTLSHPWPP